MKTRSVKVEPYKEKLPLEHGPTPLPTPIPSIKEPCRRKPYNPRFKQIIAGLPSRVGGHHQITLKQVKRRERRRMNYRKKRVNQGSCINLLVIKSQMLQDGEMRHVGRLNPEDLDALALEEDPLIQMEALKALPTPLLGKRIVRSRLSANPAKVLTGFDAWKYRRKLEWRRLRIQTKEATTFLELWGSSFKRIEGVFGNGVSSYFRFLRWLFMLNVVIFLLMFIFIVIPHIVFDKGTTSDDITTTPTGVNTTAPMTTDSPTTVDQNMTLATSSLVLHEYCTNMYDVKYDPSFTQLVLDFMQGTGWMEKTILFYGVYRPRDLTIGTWDEHQYHYNMPLAYILVTLSYLALSFYAMISHTNVTLREQLKDSFTSKRSNRGYANLGFASWDFTLYSPEAALTRHNNLFNEMRGHLEEERLLARRQARTTADLCLLVLIRTIINVFVLATLAGAAYLIYYATLESTKFKERPDYADYHQLVQLGMEFLPSLTITFLNFLIPLIFTQVARGEDYHPDFEVRITLIRTVFLRLASLAVLLATIYYQVLCSPRDACQVGQPPHCPQLRCWETYVGQNLYKLLILNFIVNVAVVFLVETPKQIIGSKCKIKVLKLIGQKSEFAIPKNVLDLVYVQTICWLGSFFAPILPAMSMGTFFFLFYLKKLTVLYNYKPAKKPYRSSRSQVFFMLVLLAAFLLCCIPIGYCIWKVSPSLGCGPFRNYTHMYDVINIFIATWPMVAQDILTLLTSTTSAVILIIILGLLLYYYRGASKGHQEAVLLLREQMMLESRDKQFLLARLNEVTGSQQQATASLSDVKPEPERTSIDMPPSGAQRNYSTFSPSSEGKKNYGAFGDSGAPLASSESISRDSTTS